MCEKTCECIVCEVEFQIAKGHILVSENGDIENQAEKEIDLFQEFVKSGLGS